MSIFVVRAFTAMRDQLTIRDSLEKRLTATERKLLRHDTTLQALYKRLRQLSEEPKKKPPKRIGFKTPSQPEQP